MAALRGSLAATALLALAWCAGAGPAAASEFLNPAVANSRPSVDRASVGQGVLAGKASDTFGHLLAGVEVLFVDPGSAARPVAVALTDASGRFRVPGLGPDVYRVAALKDGYLTWVATIDSRVQRWIDVMLHPMPALDSDEGQALPRRPEWALRLPRRSILRDSGATVESLAADTRADVRSAIDDGWRMQIEQMFAMGGGADGPGADATRGSETSVRVDSLIGQRGAIQVDGRHRTLQRPKTPATPTASLTDEDSGSLAVAFSYDTSLDSTVSVNAFYDQTDATWNPDVIAARTAPSEQSAWGYDARWATQLDADSRLAVSMDYRGGSMRMAGVPTDPAGSGLDPGSLDSHAVAASGTYESLAATDHRLQVDVRAQLMNAPLPLFQPGGPSAPERMRVTPGLAIGLNAQDTWFVGGPFSMRYGLGYRHAVDGSEASLIVPRIGGIFSSHDVVVRMTVSYSQFADWTARDNVAAPIDPLGYEAELELPLSHDVSLRGAASSIPVQFDFVGFGYGDSRVDSQAEPLYLTDGNAAVRQRSVALVKDVGGTQTYVEYAEGEAAGTLAAYVPGSLPLRRLDDRSLAYRAGRVGVRVAPSGTDVMVDYRHVDEGETGRAGDTSRQRALELRVVQELFRRPGAGNWRLLVALRSATVALDDADGDAGEPQELDLVSRRISAGVSVLF